MRRVYRDNLTGHEPVKEHPNCSQMLLYGWLRYHGPELLDIGGNVNWLYESKVGQPASLTPRRELSDGNEVRLPGVLVPDIDGKEFPEPFSPVRTSEKEGRQLKSAATLTAASWRFEGGATAGSARAEVMKGIYGNALLK